MATTGPAFGALLREALVIFAGVVVALAADDWRQNRQEQAEAELSLGVILSDLRRDSAMAVATRASARQHLAAADWLVMQRRAAAPNRDSLNASLQVLERFTRPVFSRAGYEGLRTSNQMGLIGTENLRSALAVYYEVDQVRFEGYSQIVYGRREELLEAMAARVDHRSSPAAVNFDVILVGQWDAFVAEPRLLTRLSRYGRSVRSMMEQFDSLDRILLELIQSVDAELNPRR